MATEMHTTPQDQTAARPASELDPQALAAIRDLLQTEPEVAPQPVAERQAAKVARAMAPTPEAAEPHAAMRDAEPEPKAKKRKRVSSGGGMIADAKASVLNYRPSPRHIVLASLALLIFFRPWLMFGLLFFTFFFMGCIFLILGYDGFWKRAMSVARWYAQRRPHRAAEMHHKLDSFAMKWDAVLDRFPEGSVDGLYLPDFGDLATAEARHDEALDRRFANLAEREA